MLFLEVFIVFGRFEKPFRVKHFKWTPFWNLKLDRVDFFSKLFTFYLNIHIEFYKSRLKNVKNTNYFVKKTKRFSGEQSIFRKNFYLWFSLCSILTLETIPGVWQFTYGTLCILYVKARRVVLLMTKSVFMSYKPDIVMQGIILKVLEG